MKYLVTILGTVLMFNVIISVTSKIPVSCDSSVVISDLVKIDSNKYIRSEYMVNNLSVCFITKKTREEWTHYPENDGKFIRVVHDENNESNILVDQHSK